MDLSAYEDVSEKLKALGHPLRLRIALILVEHEYSVGALCAVLNLPQASLSQHLSVLRNKGVVLGKRDGTSIIYGIHSEAIIILLETIRDNLQDFSKKRRSSSTNDILRA